MYLLFEFSFQMFTVLSYEVSNSRRQTTAVTILSFWKHLPFCVLLYIAIAKKQTNILYSLNKTFWRMIITMTINE